MYKKCQTAKSRERQRYIADALVDMMGEMSFREVQISELCRRADVPRKAFYRYFDTKEDVITFLAETALAESAEGGDFIERELGYGEGMGVHLFRYWKEHAALFRALTDRDSYGIFQEAYIDMIMSNELGHSRVSKKHKNNRAVAMFCASGFMGMLLMWERHGFQKSPEEMGKLFNRMLTEPLYE